MTKDKPAGGFKDYSTRIFAGWDFGYDLKCAAVEDFDIIGLAVADIAVLAVVIESNLMGIVQAFDFADELAFVYIYDLYYGAMGDVELRSGGVEGKVVPVALAADLPGFLDVKKLAGNFGGLWSLGRRGKRAGE